MGLIQMNTATLVVLALVVALIAGAVYGCFRTLHSKKCCGSGKSCCKDEETCHCSIRKEQ